MRKCFFILGIVILSASCASPNNETRSEAASFCISDTSRTATSAYLTRDQNNNPVISWCETDAVGKKYFHLSFFDSLAGMFISPVDIPIEQNAGFHEEGMPKIVFKGDGTIVAIYETASPTKENEWAGYLQFIQSFDNGKTWTNPHAVHSDTAANGSRSFAAATRLSDGEIGVCWLDESFDRKTGGRSVKFSKTNKSNGFAKELIIDSIACQCCRLAISGNSSGKISIAFRDIINDSIRDISVCHSNDNGKSFSSARPFSKDGWSFNGCPHNGPSIANTDEQTYATWFTGGANSGVYYGAINTKGEMLEKRLVSRAGRFIQVCVMPNGTRILAYNEIIRQGDSTYSKIVLNKMENDKVYAQDITTSTTHASYPVVESISNGSIMLSWVEKNRIYYTTRNPGNIITEVNEATGSLSSHPGYNPSVNPAAHKDLVCGMPVEETVSVKAELNGKSYSFCSDLCKNKFLSWPAAYTKR